MTHPRLFVSLLSWLLFSSFAFSQTCSISLTSPTKTDSLPREVSIKISVSPNNLVKEIKKGDSHVYFFQKNTLEPEGLWHFNSTPHLTQNVLSGKLWLGGETQGRNEDFILMVLISNEKKAFITGPNNIDVVYTKKDLPVVVCNGTFKLHRGQ